MNENFNDEIKVYKDNYIFWSFIDYSWSLLVLYKLKTYFYFSQLSNCQISTLEFAKYFIVYNSCNIFLYLNGKFIIIRYSFNQVKLAIFIFIFYNVKFNFKDSIIFVTNVIQKIFRGLIYNFI